MENSNGNGKGLSTVRLDLATRLGLMASLIFACGPDGTTMETAVNTAAEINERCESRAKFLKLQESYSSAANHGVLKKRPALDRRV